MDRTKDNGDTLQDIARNLPELAARLASMKDEALKRLHSPEYDSLRLRLEIAHSAVEARRRLRLNEERPNG